MEKKSFWSLFAIMMVSALCLGLTSCSDDDDDNDGGNVNLENVEPGVLTGKWQCVSIACVEDGEKDNREVNESYYLIINEDGTAIVNPWHLFDMPGLSSNDINVNWSAERNKLILRSQIDDSYLVLTIKKLTRNELVTEAYDGDDYTETHTFKKVTE